MFARFIEKAFTFLIDIVAFNVAFATAFWIRYKSNFFPESFNADIEFSSYILLSITVAGCWAVLFFVTGLYRDWYKESRLDEFFVVVRTILIGIFLLFLITSASQIIDFATSGNLGSYPLRARAAFPEPPPGHDQPCPPRSRRRKLARPRPEPFPIVGQSEE